MLPALPGGMRRTENAVAALLGLAVLSVGGRAAAESAPAPPSCEVVPSPPIAQGVAIPSNVPAIPLMKRFDHGGVGTVSVRSATSGTFRVEDDPRSDLYLLLRPEQPLATGASVTVALDVACVAPGTGTSPDPLTINAGPEQSLPTTLGEVRVDAARTRASVVLSPEAVAFATTLGIVTTVEPSDAPRPVTSTSFDYSLSSLTREVLVGTSSFGSGVPNLDANAVKQLVVSDVAVAAAVCGGRVEGTQDYQLRVQGHVAGAATDPPALVIPLTVACASAAHARPAATADATSNAEAREAGCSLAATPGRERSTACLAMLVAAASVLARTRRRG